MRSFFISFRLLSIKLDFLAALLYLSYIGFSKISGIYRILHYIELVFIQKLRAIDDYVEYQDYLGPSS